MSSTQKATSIKRARLFAPMDVLAVTGCLAAAALLGASCAATPDDDAVDYEDGAEPSDDVAAGVSGGNVAEAVKAACSTASVKGLSEQIIAEGNCIEPGAYVALPDMANLSVKSNIFAYLEAPARDALVAALEKNPKKTLQVNSMLRTVAQQYLLYRWYQSGTCGIGLAAKPGASNHETGLALDINDSSSWRSALEAEGFKWLGSKDPPHFDYAGDGAVSHKGLDVKAFQRLWNRNHPEDKISEDGQWGPQTEARLKQAPAAGFPIGATCSSDPADPPDPNNPPDPPDPNNPPDPQPQGIWKPAPGTTWQWQLTGTLDKSFNVKMYDVDLFKESKETIGALKAQGRVAICYFSAGSYEGWRPDAGLFKASDLGKALDGWPDEKWLDIRSANVRQIMQKRMDLAVSMGCDGVEPDNVDGYANDSGFSLSSSDQIAFNKFLATEAHARNLSVGLKNALDLIPALQPSFDWALNEQCLEYSECETLKPFISAGKAVFHVEYVDSTSQGSSKKSSVCGDASIQGFSTLIKLMDLDAWRLSCQ